MRLVVFSLAFLASTAVSVAQELDLKTQTQIQFRTGRMYIVDTYERARLSVGTSSVLISVLQYRLAESNTSCGSLTERRVRISSQALHLDIDAKQFDEFVGAVNYLSKYQESWENMRARKSKSFSYFFNADEKREVYDALELTGDRENLALSLKQKRGLLFSTRDLRVVISFNESINATKKFIDNHNFNECL